MALTNAGRDFLAQAATSLPSAPTLFNNANARIGVGNSTAAFSAAHTNLQGGANTFRKAMDGGYPQRTDNVLTFRATFGTTEANFAWQEWGVFNAASAGVMLNRKVENLSTKPDTQSWQFTVTLTLTAA